MGPMKPVRLMTAALAAAALSLTPTAAHAATSTPSPVAPKSVVAPVALQVTNRSSVAVLTVVGKYLYFSWTQFGLRNMSPADFTKYVYGQIGVSLPSTAAGQQKALKASPVPVVGGLVFQKGTPRVGIYVGNGVVVEWVGTFRISRLWSGAIFAAA